MGAVCAMVYLFVLIFFIPWPFYKDIVVATSGGGNRDVMKELKEIETGRFLHRFPHNKLASYLSAILSLQSIVLLGIGDDLFDIRWRHKVLIPAFAVIPMLVVYFVDFGVTQMVVPLPLRPYLGELFDLGTLALNQLNSTRANLPRLAILRLHGTDVHFLVEQYQHSRGYQRH
jgi:UDP-N-acetylglucosamine--dolichyl-phosphate N-acetylglucosaminephosphotransferase